MIKLLAFDLDGTLTQHKSPLGEENKAVLNKLAEKYKLLMVGAGSCARIHKQLGNYPIDIIGNYGLQFYTYDKETGGLTAVRNLHFPVERESVEARVTALRAKHGFTSFVGENVEFHESGAVTIPLLGTKAELADKLVFDPDKSRRKKIYDEVKALFSEYVVFVSGTSSFDMVPSPYDKYYALDLYCKEHGIAHDEVIFVGDDYGEGGTDESVYRSDFGFICMDDYTKLGERLAELL